MNRGVEYELDNLFKGRTGPATSVSSVSIFHNKLGHLVPGWYTEMLQRWPIAGTSLNYLGEGVEQSLDWFTLEQTIEECSKFYPGIWLLPHGYIPVAGCSTGSGDSYYIHFTGIPNEYLANFEDDLTDPMLIRIYHDAVGESAELTPNSFSLVGQSLSVFFRYAKIAICHSPKDI